MGYRAYQRIESKIKYDDYPSFNYENEELAVFLSKYDKNHLNIYDEAGNTKSKWEIHIDDLKDAIKDLKANFKKDEIVFNNTNASKLIQIFEEWIKINEKNKENLNYPDIIMIDWF